MSDAGCTLFVCVSCQVADATAPDGTARPGRDLLAALREAGPIEGVTIAPVDCLAVCKRPTTVALSGPERWIYVIGDLAGPEAAAEIRDYARAYALTENGIVAWRDRPKSVRKGVISRTPPPHFRQPEAAE
ncbi:MAG: DUF1636 family protein [Labrys sp. (in: a-proteobacteria)]